MRHRFGFMDLLKERDCDEEVLSAFISIQNILQFFQDAERYHGDSHLIFKCSACQTTLQENFRKS